MEKTNVQEIIKDDQPEKVSGYLADPELQEGEKKPNRSPIEQKLVRKINCILLPLVAWIIMVHFSDGAALSVSAVLGIYEDTNLTGSQFSWVGSIYFLGYLVYQVPNQFFMQKFPIGRYLGVMMIIWGVVMVCTSQAHTFQQLIGLRFLLGLLVASGLPCVYMIIANMYRRREQPFYFGVVTMFQSFGAILANLVAVGIADMGSQRGISQWRWIHIIFGTMTIFLGFLCFFFLLDSPNSKLLRLSEEEKEIVHGRIKDNAVVRNNRINFAHFIEALKEPRLYLLCVGALCINIPNGGLVIFSAQFIKTLGNFTSTESILLKIPGGVASTLFSMLASIIAQRYGQIGYTGVGMCLICLSGLLILAAVPGGAVKLLGYYLSWGLSGGLALFATTVGNNVSGYSKKLFYNSCLLACSTIGQFIGPLVMLAPEAPRYTTGMIVFCVADVVALFSFLAVRWVHTRGNSQKLANPPLEETDVSLGLTDVQDRNFIYRL
ncbi:major facilitator superfamily domain-containing protein [Dichotomocladium elegans]|nr:major facilitator superfamily domain-containing protein [Dichotomocladium elegans]